MTEPTNDEQAPTHIEPSSTAAPSVANVTGDTIGALMLQIQRTYKEGGDWCSLDKAQALASIVVAIRPRILCEVGVWMGGSLVPMLMALRTLEQIEQATHGISTKRRAIAIDAWSNEASVVGQSNDDLRWWGGVDHEAALFSFMARLEKHGLGALCDVIRAPSDRANVDRTIDLLHIDGNHAEQAVRDVMKFGSKVTPGGIMVLDDLDWKGGHVETARDHAVNMGFRALYPLGTGIVMQRTHVP